MAGKTQSCEARQHDRPGCGDRAAKNEVAGRVEDNLQVNVRPEVGAQIDDCIADETPRENLDAIDSDAVVPLPLIKPRRKSP